MISMMDNWPGIFKESNQSIAAKLLNKASRVVFHWVLHDANIFPCRQSGGGCFTADLPPANILSGNLMNEKRRVSV